MSEYVNKLADLLVEDVIVNEEQETCETFPYVEKLAVYLDVDPADLYVFFTVAHPVESLADVEKFKDSMNDWEYEIYHKFFDKFGKYDSDFLKEDFSKFDTTQEEYNTYHSSLNF